MAKYEDVVTMLKNRLAYYEERLLHYKKVLTNENANLEQVHIAADCFNSVYESYIFTDAILADVLAVSIKKPSRRNQKDEYTVAEISDIVGTNSETVRRWIRNGLLNAELSSKKSGYIIHKEDLQLFMDQHTKYMRDI